MSGTIKLPAAEVAWLLRGALAAASRDDVTPVLAAVEWRIEGGRATVTSTDRYRVHQLYSKHLIGDDVADAPAEGTFLMHRSQAARLLKSLPTRRGDLAPATVELTWIDAEQLPVGHTGRIGRRFCGSIHFDIDFDGTGEGERLAHDAAQVRGNFPPVDRLFPSDEAAADGDFMPQIAMQPEFLADTRWLRSGHGSLRFVVPRIPEGKPKVAPVLVVNTEGTARALIQPIMMHATGSEWKVYGS